MFSVGNYYHIDDTSRLVELGVGDSFKQVTTMETLLVLEDEAIVMKMLRRSLREYNLVEAASAEQALRLFFSPDHQIDLLIADVTLPTSSGVHVALLLRGEIPDLPIILTSGYPSSAWNAQDAADLETLGPNSVTVLQKPFHFKELSNVASQLLAAPRSMKAGSAY